MMDAAAIGVEGSAGPLALGVGVWLSAMVAWWVGDGQRRWDRLMIWGWVVAAAFGGGVAMTWLMGGVGLSSRGGAVVVFGVLVGALGIAWRQGPGSVERVWRECDWMAPSLLTGLSVARLGCLWEGCDIGRPTESSLAVVHPPGTRGFEAQVLAYDVSPLASAGMEVHPFALYLGGWGLMCAVIGGVWRRRARRRGEAAVVTLMTFGAGGALIEGLREPALAWTVSGVLLYPAMYISGALAVSLLWWLSWR